MHNLTNEDCMNRANISARDGVFSGAGIDYFAVITPEMQSTFLPAIKGRLEAPK